LCHSGQGEGVYLDKREDENYMKKRGSRLVAAFLSAAMTVAMIPAISSPVISKAAGNKKIACVGTKAIKAPDPGEISADATWKGSYVWYGNYNDTSMKYRVLDPKTTKFGGTTMLLDCDNILYKGQFDKDGKKNYGASRVTDWAYSDIKSSLNGMDFLNKEGVFSEIEKDSIFQSEIATHALAAGESSGNVSDWLEQSYKNYVALNNEKIFLLDTEDACNKDYGFYPSENRVGSREKKSIYDSKYATYLLRSGQPDDDEFVGYIMEDFLWGVEVDTVVGVSPAFNVDLNSVIFSSLVSGNVEANDAEYKLTLKDNDLEVAVPEDKNVTIAGDVVSVPYSISGKNNKNATQVSVLILDKQYMDGNSNNANVLYYDKLNISDSFSSEGEGVFELPSDLGISKWGVNYHVYLLAEDVNDGKETDYASLPIKLARPIKAYTVKVTNDENGTADSSVKRGITDTEVSLTASPSGGYKFKEWQVIKGGVTVNDNKFKVAVEDVEIKAIFEPAQYTITFNSIGGTVDPQKAVTGKDGKLSSLPVPTREGFKFIGWFTSPVIASHKVEIDDVYFEDKVLFARWEKLKSYTVKFETNGGTSISDVSVYENDKLTKIGTPTRVADSKYEYVFAGWYIDKELTKLFDLNTSINSDNTVDGVLKLFAKWEKKEKKISTQEKTTEKTTSDQDTSKNDGIGTFSQDGKTLTDTDGVKYKVSDKITNAQLKKNAKIADKKSAGKYRITKITKENGEVVGGTVEYMAPYNKNTKLISATGKVKLAGVTFTVTSISQNCGKGCKNLSKVVIGDNVTNIGKNAFNGCDKLKTINIKSKKLKKVGANAFKGINKKATISVPKAKKKAYTKLLKGKGQAKTVKIK
jgi:hypothetical protein